MSLHNLWSICWITIFIPYTFFFKMVVHIKLTGMATTKIIIICYIYIALFWVLKVLYKEAGGGGLLNHQQCSASNWMMRRQPYCTRAPTTHQLSGGEETVMQPICVWGWLGGHDGQRSVGKFSQDDGVTPLLFFEVHLGILYWPQSIWVLGLTSHPKDGAFYRIVSLSLYWSIRTHVDCRESTPCWSH